jgi:LAGLIDADG DNA endonuclease family protein
MAKSQSIKPFPADIDLAYFGAWLSGFTDGEGCFNLYFTSHNTPGAAFTIALRQDDDAVLRLIQSFWGCGRLYLNSRITVGKRVFTAQYSVNVVPDLARILVPHFQRFPLFAKKSRDYLIWKEGIALICSRERRGKDKNGQFGKRWTDEEKSQFAILYHSLKTQREFDTSTAHRFTYPAATQPPLFN